MAHDHQISVSTVVVIGITDFTVKGSKYRVARGQFQINAVVHAAVAPAVGGDHFPAHRSAVTSVANVRGAQPQRVLLLGPIKIQNMHLGGVPMDAKHFRFLVFKPTEHFVRRRDAVQINRARRQGGKTLRLSLSTRTRREQQQ